MGISREEIQNMVNKIILNFGKEYLSTVEKYKEVLKNENYSDKYKASMRDELLEEVKIKRSETYKKALELVNSEREKLEKEKGKDENLSIEEKTLQALERNNLILLTSLKVKEAPIQTLRDIFQESNLDNDVKTIIQAELSTRKEKSEEQLILERELKRTVDIFSTVESNIKYKILDKDIIQISLGSRRSISKDFNLEGNHSYFSLAEEKENYFMK